MRILGKISDQEEEEIEILSEKLYALKNLIKIIPESDTVLYEKCQSDYSSISQLYQSWWTDIVEKYGWKVMEGENLNINFLTCDMFVNE